MKTCRIGSIVLAPAFLILTLTQASHAENENEWRASEVLLIPFLELEGIGRTTLRLENSDRWKDDFNDHFEHRNQFSLRVPIPTVDGLNWEAGYWRRDRDSGGQNGYLFNLTWNQPKFCGTDWELRFRNQWELSDLDGSSDQSYRSRFRFLFVRDLPWIETAGHPWKLGLGHEAFWKPEEGGIDENHFGGGIQIPFSSTAVLQLGTIWRRMERSGAGSGNDDSFLFTVSLQIHLPKPGERTTDRPIFDENLHKEF